MILSNGGLQSSLDASLFDQHLSGDSRKSTKQLFAAQPIPGFGCGSVSSPGFGGSHGIHNRWMDMQRDQVCLEMSCKCLDVRNRIAGCFGKIRSKKNVLETNTCLAATVFMN